MVGGDLGPVGRNSKRGMARTSEEVTSLVAAVQEHIKFKQLAVYSIDTFSKVLAPPNPRWREYIDVAIDIDAASTVIKARGPSPSPRTRRPPRGRVSPSLA